jgi:PHD/YefM family antitoxin component YafN of YafNO toxin-antitoxin module
LNRVSYSKERIVIQRHGKDVAAIVPIEDLQFLEDLENQLDLEEARNALEEARGQAAIPWNKVKSDLNL